MRWTPTARVMKSAPLKKRTLLRLKCHPAMPIGTKRTTHAANNPNWTAPNIAPRSLWNSHIRFFFFFDTTREGKRRGKREIWGKNKTFLRLGKRVGEKVGGGFVNGLGLKNLKVISFFFCCCCCWGWWERDNCRSEISIRGVKCEHGCENWNLLTHNNNTVPSDAKTGADDCECCVSFRLHLVFWSTSAVFYGVWVWFVFVLHKGLAELQVPCHLPLTIRIKSFFFFFQAFKMCINYPLILLFIFYFYGNIT